MKARIHNGKNVVMVTETIAPFARAEIPIGSVLYSIGRNAVGNLRYDDCMKALETCPLPVVLVLELPDKPIASSDNKSFSS